MRGNYRPFTDEDRETLKRLHAEGKINREISFEMDRGDSTISKQMQMLGLKPNTLALRRLRLMNEKAAKLREIKRRPEPAHERYTVEPRPAAIKGGDSLLNALQAGRR